MLTVLHDKRQINIPLISLLIIVVLFLGILKSDEMVPICGNCAKQGTYLCRTNNLSEISSTIAIKMDDLKELSQKQTDSGRAGTVICRGFFTGVASLIILMLFRFFGGLLFYSFRAIRCNRLFTISYIHNLDGMKP